MKFDPEMKRTMSQRTGGRDDDFVDFDVYAYDDLNCQIAKNAADTADIDRAFRHCELAYA